MNVRPAALIGRVQNNQIEILLMHYRYGGQDVYALPGGNPDRGEALSETIVREIWEELGITVEVGALVLCGEVLTAQHGKDVLHTLFACRYNQGEPALNPAHTTALEWVWQPIDELDGLTLYPNVGKAIQEWFSTDSPGACYTGPVNQPYFE